MYTGRVVGEVNFTAYPSKNVTIIEGGTHHFTCKAFRVSNNETLVPYWYFITINDIRLQISMSTAFPDGTVATLNSDHGMLTLSNFTKSLNGITLACAVNPGTETLQPMPYPVISIDGKKLSIHTFFFQVFSLQS